MLYLSPPQIVPALAASDVVPWVTGVCAGIATLIAAVLSIPAYRSKVRVDRTVAAVDEQKVKLTAVEVSQASLVASLDRADADRQRAEERLAAEEQVTRELTTQLSSLEGRHDQQITALRTEVRQCHRRIDALADQVRSLGAVPVTIEGVEG